MSVDNIAGMNQPPQQAIVHLRHREIVLPSLILT